jgi:hypothetical protein
MNSRIVSNHRVLKLIFVSALLVLLVTVRTRKWRVSTVDVMVFAVGAQQTASV